MPIRLLAPEIAARIAAGEVVERPANAVKELVENSLDAGARDVRVEIREGGRRLLRVADDGDGIPEGEALLAFQRHATSKLETAGDLERIHSFGFRGEALFSIAAVSRITLLTRSRSEPYGTQVRMEGGRLLDQSRAAAPVGTQVTVENLFYNLPARQKFLKSDPTEAGQISSTVQRFALALPEVRFSLIVDGRLVFQSHGSGDLFDVLVQTMGAEAARQMVRIGLPAGTPGRATAAELADPAGIADPGDIADIADIADDVQFMDVLPPRPNPQGPSRSPGDFPVRVTGAVALPSLTRANRTGIQLFVNRRAIEDRNLTHAVVQAYHTLLPVGRFPVAVVFLEMDPAALDVNVHPQKLQVRFLDERRVFSTVRRTIQSALVEHVEVPVMGAGAPPAGESLPDSWNNSLWAAHVDVPSAGPQTAFMLPTPPVVYGTRLATEDETVPTSAPAPATGGDVGRLAREDGLSVPSPAYATDADTLPRARTQVPPLRVVGQIGATYIVAEGPAGMYLVDQHAAHERILYEQYMDRRYGLEGSAPARQQLLQPATLDAGSELAGLVADHLRELNDIGFAIEPFGGDAFLVRAVPALLSGEDPVAALRDIVSELGGGRNLVGEAWEAELVKMVCKRAAIKAGQLLSDLEMQELLRQLEECRSPRTCPHGRPTMIQLSAGDLEKAFGRV